MADGIRILCPECHKDEWARKNLSDLPAPIRTFVDANDTPEVQIPALVVGRLTRHHGKYVESVFVQFEAYSGTGPINLTAVNPNLVVHQ